MTTPEDRVVWESDEDALYRAGHAQISTESDERAEDGSQDAGDATGDSARRDRYAEAIWGKANTNAAAAAVMAVADEELAGRDATIAGLRAEVEGLRRDVAGQTRSAQNGWRTADAYRKAKQENDERFQIEAATQRERAEAAEAERDAIRQAVEALADEMAGYRTLNRSWPWVERLRALASSAPAVSDGDGEGATSEAAECSHSAWIHIGYERCCASCGIDRDELPASPVVAPSEVDEFDGEPDGCALNGCHPVVAPSATDEEA